MTLIKFFKQELKKSKLFDYSDKIVVGVSGGRDSICLVTILKECGYDVAIAHCNFSLRSGESDDDMLFVKEYAAINGIDIHVVTFDTNAEAKKHGESIQIAARRLRYEWFDLLVSKFGYTKIAIAHNSDDCAETFFINLIRGTGIKGLRGIRIKRDIIVRPLLFASRDEITAFCEERKIEFRDDSTNSSDKYLRNKIRHHITPLFKDLNKEFNKTMISTTENIGNSSELLDFFVKGVKEKAVVFKENDCIVKLCEFDKVPNQSYLLFEVIREYGFFAEECLKIMNAYAEQKSGLRFLSKMYEALLNRGELHIRKYVASEKSGVEMLNIGSDVVCGDFIVSAEIVSINELKQDGVISLKSKPNIALFDIKKVTFPITIRAFKDGDIFMPFGMKGSKKVSDFMIDKKLSAFEKQRVLIMLSGDNIMWVAPYRTDNRYCVSNEALEVLRVKVCLKK